jgi:hypothetical protein
MATERIARTLIILEAEEVRRVAELARRNNPDDILQFVSQVIAKKVEAALRKRCR